MKFASTAFYPPLCFPPVLFRRRSGADNPARSSFACSTPVFSTTTSLASKPSPFTSIRCAKITSNLCPIYTMHGTPGGWGLPSQSVRFPNRPDHRRHVPLVRLHRGIHLAHLLFRNLPR